MIHKKAIEETIEEIILEKAPLVALCACFKCHITPFKDIDGRVGDMTGDI